MQHNDAEQLLIPPVEKLEWGNEVEVCQRHFAGATLVRINKDCFLFDCDREELKRFGFNPFFTRLPAFVKTVDEAYEELMPDEVKKAIKDGKAVQRQGEFFFVPADNEKVRKFSLSKQHTSDSHIFTYCDVLAKILELGMAQFQGLRKRAYDGVKKYLAYCQRVYGGKIPLVTEKASEHDAAETLKPYMDSLLAKPALEINWNEISSRFERLERRRADFRKKAKKLKEESEVPQEYIDLTTMDFPEESSSGGRSAILKVAEIGRYEDLGQVTNHIYNGNILLLDYTAICNDQLTLKRITNELKSITKDTCGDMAGIGKNLLVVTPKGIKIDRNKIKPSY